MQILLTFMLLGFASSRENVDRSMPDGKYTLYFSFVLYDHILLAIQGQFSDSPSTRVNVINFVFH
jgi:hypothetical protein